MLRAEVRMVSFTRVRIGRGGLPVCTRCSPELPSSELRAAEDVLADVRDAVRSWDVGPGPSIWLARADGFAHPDLPRLVDASRMLGVERLKVSTAGPALAHGSNATGSIEAGLRHVEVVVLAVDQVPDAVASVSPFQLATEGVAAYVEAANTLGEPAVVVGRVLACEHTYAIAPATVAALGAAGAVAVTVEFTAKAPRPDPQWMRAAVDSGLVNRAWVQFEGLAPYAGASADTGTSCGPVLSGVRAWNDEDGVA